MPSDDGLGLDEEQGLLPVGPEARQAHPKQSVGGPEFGFGRLPIEDCELMSERQVFKRQSGMGLEAGEQRAEKRRNDLEHDEPTLAEEIGISTFSNDYGAFATHRRKFIPTPKRQANLFNGGDWEIGLDLEGLAQSGKRMRMLQVQTQESAQTFNLGSTIRALTSPPNPIMTRVLSVCFQPRVR